MADTFTETYNSGFLSFCRLVGSVYLSKSGHMLSSVATKFRKPTPLELYLQIQEVKNTAGAKSNLDITLSWLQSIRQATIKSQSSEDFYLPSTDALLLHWKRTCYTCQIWQQADNNYIDYPNVTDWGWKLDNQNLSVVWESEKNIKTVNSNIKLWSGGCGCTVSNCKSSCGCKSNGNKCRPRCKCRCQCVNAPENLSIAALRSEFIDDSDDVVDLTSFAVIPVTLLTDDEIDNSDDSDSENHDDFIDKSITQSASSKF